MSTRFHVATRKGLFTVERGARWSITRTSFLGDNCTIVMHDPRNGASAKGKSRRKSGDGALYVAIDHGHFGVERPASITLNLLDHGGREVVARVVSEGDIGALASKHVAHCGSYATRSAG